MAKKGHKEITLTTAMHKRIVSYIDDGLSYHDAAVLAGSSERSLQRWLAKGRDATSGPHWQLWQDIQKARLQFKLSLIKDVRAAGKDPRTWTAAMTLLERMWPEEFARTDRLHLKHEGEIKTGADYDKLAGLLKDDECRALACKLLSKLG